MKFPTSTLSPDSRRQRPFYVYRLDCSKCGRHLAARHVQRSCYLRCDQCNAMVRDDAARFIGSFTARTKDEALKLAAQSQPKAQVIA